MTVQQLSLFTQGEDLPLFQQAQAEPNTCPDCGAPLPRPRFGVPPTCYACEPDEPEPEPKPRPEPATPTEALAATLHEIKILRDQLGKAQEMRQAHQFKGWSQRARPGAIDRWLRGLKFELSQHDAEKAAAIAAYEGKRQARIDRLHARADRAEAEAQSRFDTADRIASYIPPGQPILVGHHSEKRHRRDLDRIHNNMRRGLDAKAEAADLRHRAEAAERNRAIFSEDPQAEEKLADKIARLEQRQEMMKAANRLVKKEDRDGLAEMGFSEFVIAGLLKPDFAGRVGFADYMLKNNGANIRRLKKRLASLEARPTENKETEHEHFKVIENADEYRIQIVFDDKPAAEIRRRLKAQGFRWAPSQGAWQRHLNNAGRYAAEAFAQWYKEEVSQCQ